MNLQRKAFCLYILLVSLQKCIAIISDKAKGKPKQHYRDTTENFTKQLTFQNLTITTKKKTYCNSLCALLTYQNVAHAVI